MDWQKATEEFRERHEHLMAERQRLSGPRAHAHDGVQTSVVAKCARAHRELVCLLVVGGSIIACCALGIVLASRFM